MEYTIDEEITLLEKYNLTPTELFLIRLLLIAQEERNENYISRYLGINNGNSIRDNLISLQNKGIILKSYKVPDKGQKLIIEDIEFNKNVVKNLHRASFDMGKELYDVFPQTTTVNGQVFNLKRVSKKFNDLEDAFFHYGKAIRFKNELHQEILELVKWGIDNMYNFTTLDCFIVDHDWNNIRNIRDNNGINVNLDAVKMI